MRNFFLALVAVFMMSCANGSTPKLYSKTLGQTENAAVKKSANFSAVDINGKKWTLDDFAGKYVYIDLWATWCPPCRKELPHLKEMAVALKDYNIAILGLSVDEDKSKWEASVRTGSLPGIQLFLGASSPFLQAYGVRGIPRFILLDPQGNIVDANMSRPSSTSTLKFLQELIAPQK